MRIDTHINAHERETQDTTGKRIRRLLFRKLWLPRFLYEALPYIYISCGLVALIAAAFAPDWTWILPYVILIGLVCLHAGLAIATMRVRFRKRRDKSAQP